jgi:hypothetical protein
MWIPSLMRAYYTLKVLLIRLSAQIIMLSCIYGKNFLTLSAISAFLLVCDKVLLLLLAVVKKKNVNIKKQNLK